ncbi:polymerase [Pseudomonas cavernicola]|uniref:Polymerase n=1 Tax=Pseudomonas cavernicola TaxID=2320866 RepID=A0A418XL50_9PSED|nr:lipopolysaccharide kinase InaA family protein [Pseudomonas cavernicola]RJG13193.1 polymerase [Pseudomonas cavernicola]
MRPLDETELSALLEGAQTIEADGHGLKVARLGNGDFLKLFRRKRLISSALWSPPAQRFADNAIRLVQLGIPAPAIIETFLVPSRRLSGVRYQPLPGLTLRAHWRTLEPAQRESEVERFGLFLGQLHQQGVYFRSLHLGNVLLLPEGQFGLIDLSDMKIENRPLAPWKRQRNLQHILRYEEDVRWLAGQHRTALLKGYAQSSGKHHARRLAQNIERLHPA